MQAARPVRSNNAATQPEFHPPTSADDLSLGRLGRDGWPDEPRLTIGSSSECNWVLPTPTVNSKHVALRVQDETLQLRSFDPGQPAPGRLPDSPSTVAGTPQVAATPWEPVNVWEFEYPWLQAPPPAPAAARRPRMLHYAALASLVAAAQLHRAQLPAVWGSLLDLWPHVHEFWAQWASYLWNGPK